MKFQYYFMTPNESMLKDYYNIVDDPQEIVEEQEIYIGDED